MATKNKIICGVMLALLGLGFYDVFVNFQDNGCAMTYMFQWPSYVATKMEDEIKQQFPQYSLSLYGEGDYLQKSRDLKLNGIPVLFIPGNAGSYKQVRSLGSVALRKALAYSFHFNYFTIDFNEELTGIYGATLQQQTEYVHQCIKYILTLYKHKKDPPTSVVLVGHSMGGIIARALFTMPAFHHRLVHTVITQATPHISPVIGADKHLVDFYTSVNKYWKDHIDGARLKDVTLISISGGHRDTMVRSGLTSLHTIVSASRGLSVNAMSVPRVWLSTDHQCVVWCKELVLATMRALFQMVDSKTKQISTDPDYRMKVFRHHFVTHNGKEKFSVSESKPKMFENATFELAEKSRKYSVGVRAKRTIHYLFPVDRSKVSSQAFAVIAGGPARDWLFVCLEGNSTSCTRGVDISAGARLIPPLKSGLKESLVMMEEYPDAKHVVVKVASKSSVPITAEVYDTHKRNINFTLPGPFSWADANIVMELNQLKSTFYNITLLDFNLFHLAYVAHLEPLICASDLHQGANTTLRLHIPWVEGQDMFSVAPASQNNKLSLKLPSGWPESSNQTAQLHAYLNPECRYTIRVTWSLREKMGQIMRFHANLLPNFLVIVLVFTISYQLKHIYTDKAIHSFIWMQSSYSKPVAVILPISTFRGLVKYEPLDRTFELRSLEDMNISFGILPMVFFLFAYAILTQLAVVTSFKVGFCARLAFMFKGTKPNEHQLNSTGPTPWLTYVIIGALIALSSATCGTLGLLGVLLLYFFKVVGLNARIMRLRHCLNIHGAAADMNSTAAPALKEEAAAADGTDANSNDPPTPGSDAPPAKADDAAPKPKDPSPLGLARDTYNFHLAVLMLVWCLVMLNAPALVVWFKQVQYSLHLANDPSIYTAAIVCSAMIVLLDNRYTVPTNRLLCKLASWLLHAFCVLMVLYTLESTYQVSYYVAAIFVVLASLQLIQ